MISEIKDILIPKTLAEFEQWQPTDGYKYEWNDGELIRFEGMKRKHLKLVRVLAELFDTTKAKKQRGQLNSSTSSSTAPRSSCACARKRVRLASKPTHSHQASDR